MTLAVWVGPSVVLAIAQATVMLRLHVVLTIGVHAVHGPLPVLARCTVIVTTTTVVTILMMTVTETLKSIDVSSAAVSDMELALQLPMVGASYAPTAMAREAGRTYSIVLVVVTVLIIRMTMHRTLVIIPAPLASTVVMATVGPNRFLEICLSTVAMIVHVNVAFMMTHVRLSLQTEALNA